MLTGLEVGGDKECRNKRKTGLGKRSRSSTEHKSKSRDKSEEICGKSGDDESVKARNDELMKKSTEKARLEKLNHREEEKKQKKLKKTL